MPLLSNLRFGSRLILVICTLGALMIFVLARKTYNVQEQRIKDDVDRYVNEQTQMIANLVGVVTSNSNDFDESKGNRIKSILETKSFFAKGYSFVCDDNVNIIIHPQDSNQGEDTKIIREISRMLFTGNSSKNKLEHSNWYYYYAEVKDADLYVVTKIPKYEARAEIRFKQKLIIIVPLFSLVLLFIIVYLFTQTITTPLTKGVQFAKGIAEGDLKTIYSVDRKDEMANLAAALNKMTNNLSDVINKIRSAAQQLLTTGMEISESSLQVSDGANRQAATVEQLASTIDQVAHNFQEASRIARRTGEIAKATSLDLDKVSESSNESIYAIRQIASKIGVISEIAFQTNLLALNAAVEAARAGEHGKGFAVVATEVRRLAEKSKIAAQEINDLSKETVMETEKSGEQMQEIIPGIKESSDMIQKIASAILDLETGIDQVNLGVQQLNNVTQQNASAAEEMSASADTLTHGAQNFSEMINFFKL